MDIQDEHDFLFILNILYILVKCSNEETSRRGSTEAAEPPVKRNQTRMNRITQDYSNHILNILTILVKTGGTLNAKVTFLRD